MPSRSEAALGLSFNTFQAGHPPGSPVIRAEGRSFGSVQLSYLSLACGSCGGEPNVLFTVLAVQRCVCNQRRCTGTSAAPDPGCFMIIALCVVKWSLPRTYGLEDSRKMSLT